MDYPVRNIAEITNRFAPQIDQVRNAVSTYGDEASKIIRKNPGASLVGALAFGFIIGRIVSRI
jgi:hypothetical protein